MKALNTILLIFLFASALGCASPPKSRTTVVPETREHSDLLINNTLIDEKIKLLEGILKKRGLSGEDRKIALEVLDAYMLLRQSAHARLTQKQYQKIISSLFKAVSLMDEKYYQGKKISRDYPGAIALFIEKRNDIINLYLKGDFKGVIKQALELKTIFGPDALTPEIGLLFALSLAKEGDLKQAIQIGEGIANELDRLPDIIQLRSRIARWQLALGRKDRALRTYEKLTDHQDEKIALVKDVKRQINRAEKGEHADKPLNEFKPGLDDVDLNRAYDMDQLLREVRSLIEKHAYGKARILLLRERIKIADGPENELLDRELEKLEQHEEEFEEQKRIRDAYLKQTHEAAKRLVEEEKYEAAINALNEVESSQYLTAESRALKERAVESLINKERNRAAEIFLEAKKTRDPSKKKALLDSASEILKALIDNYPSSPLNQKLKSHIAIVQDELDKLK